MLERTQIQFIADKLAGRDPGANPAEMDDPYGAIYRELQPVDIRAMGAAGALWNAMHGIPNANAILNAILNAMPTGTDYPSLAKLAADLRPISWLWPSWIPRGMLSLLGASPGSGKSLVALDLARRIIHGDPWPDDTPLADPGRAVLYVDAEAIPQLQNQRALAWNMDRTRLYLMLPPESYGMIDLGNQEHQDQLLDMVHAIDPDLLIIDSMSAISVRGENNVEDVRAILGFLSAVAREYEIGCLLIHHLRKRNALPSMDLVTADDFRGSSHIIAMARSVLALSVIATDDNNRNGPRRMEIIKTNLCKYPAALGLHLDPAHPDAPTLRYTDDCPKSEPRRATCADWLLDYLAEVGEPTSPRDIVAAGEQAGHSRATIFRARKQFRDMIVDTKSPQSPANCWGLAEWNEHDED